MECILRGGEGSFAAVGTGGVKFVKLKLVNKSVTGTVHRCCPSCSVVTFSGGGRSLTLTVRRNAVRASYSSVSSGFEKYGCVFLYTPIACGTTCLSRLGSLLSRGYVLASIKDIGASVRRRIVHLKVRTGFVNKRPVTNSRGDKFVGSGTRLVRGTCCVLAPSTGMTRRGISTCGSFVSSLGTLPIVLSCRRRSRVAKAVDRLPRVVTSALIGFMRSASSGRKVVGTLTTKKFGSVAEVTSSSPIV